MCAYRVLWLRQQWTILCQCSQQTWWAPWHNRWITFRWAQQERWVEEFVSVCFLGLHQYKVQYSLFLLTPSAELVLHHWLTCLLGPTVNKLPSACTVPGHIYSHWQGWRFYRVTFKFVLLLVPMMQCTRCVYFRPCNLIHLSLVFLSQIFTTSAHSIPRLFTREGPTLIMTNVQGFLFTFNV